MNLLLLHPDECQGGLVCLTDRRAEHLRKVLKVTPGATVRAAVVGQGGAVARVRATSEREVLLEVGDVAAWATPVDHVVLAIPRPKALSRIVQTVSSFGLRSITLINAWKVDKSYLSSPRLHAERLLEDVMLGCEQGQQCHPPVMRILTRFSLFLEQEHELFTEPCTRVVLHPRTPHLLHTILGESPGAGSASSSCVLVLGPDGGFLDQEIQGLMDHGYVPARLNVGPLRTEAAAAAALGVRTISRADRGELLPHAALTPG